MEAVRGNARLCVAMRSCAWLCEAVRECKGECVCVWVRTITWHVARCSSQIQRVVRAKWRQNARLLATWTRTSELTVNEHRSRTDACKMHSDHRQLFERSDQDCARQKNGRLKVYGRNRFEHVRLQMLTIQHEQRCAACPRLIHSTI